MVPCSRIVEYVKDYEGSVQIHRDELTVDAKSIFDLLTLNAPMGTVLVVEATGEGSEQLLDSLEQLFEREFES